MGVGILAVYGRSREPNKRSIRQGFTQVGSKPVKQTVLGSVGFIRHHDNVLPFGKYRVGSFSQLVFVALLQSEFLDGREDDTTASCGQQFAQIVCRFSALHIANQVFGQDKVFVQLKIQITSIDLYHNGWVFQLGQAAQDSGINRHRNAFAAALGVPNHANTTVAERF